MKKQGYKAAPTNKNVGNKTHGSFGNDGQKSGKHGANAAKPSKEKLADMAPEKYMKKVVNDLRKQGKRRITMMDGGGAFH